MPQNEAAFLPSPRSPLTVGPLPLPSPGPTQLIIRTHAVATNPLDWKIQASGLFITSYPAVLGVDLSGEVYSIGSGVTSFKPGDRVLGYTNAVSLSFDAEAGAFQRFTRVEERLASKIPDSVSYTDAAVLPLALATAAEALYEPQYLGLPLPSMDPAPAGKILLIWGAASAVGLAAVQLAVASGVSVIATASRGNMELVKSLGAREVFDYRSPSVVQDIVAAIVSAEEEFVGAIDPISVPDSLEKVKEVLIQAGGGRKICVTLPVDAKGLEGVEVLSIRAGEIFGNEKLCKAIYGEFVPRGLESGRLKTVPEALIVGKGLEMVHKGLDRHKEGVSARKVVVEIQ